MYGKHFDSMYTGSMIGAGAVVFAVWGYVIAHGKPDRKVGMQVELNPKLLAFVLGEPEGRVEEAIEFLCQPDPRSRSEAEEGRRLVRLSEYSYRVVNGPKYRAIRDAERRRETDRESKRRQRARVNGIELTAEQQRSYDEARVKGRQKVTKREVERAGEIAGRTEGVVEAVDLANETEEQRLLRILKEAEGKES